MNLRLRSNNAKRDQGAPIQLQEVGNDSNTFCLIPGRCLAFWKEENDRKAVTYINLNELTLNVFQLDFFRFENSINDQHTDILYTYKEKEFRISLDGMFRADQYRFVYETVICDVELLSTTFFRLIQGGESIGVIDLKKGQTFNQAMQAKIIECFNGNLQP